MEELINKAYSDKKKRLNQISKADKLFFITENGWVLNKRGDLACDMYSNNKKNVLGITLEMAYEMEYQDKLTKQRKEDMQEGKIKIICNKCGDDCQKLDSDMDGNEFSVGYYGLIDAEVSGGYYSDHLSDCVNYKFSLCEKCVKEMFDTFKVKPDVYVYMP